MRAPSALSTTNDDAGRDSGWPMREGDTVWIGLEGKRRPGVVIERQDEFVRVAYGTHEDRTYPCAVVRQETRQGRCFPLTEEVTYFYGANTTWLGRDELEPGQRRCALELVFAIRRLVEEWDARVDDERG